MKIIPFFIAALAAAPALAQDAPRPIAGALELRLQTASNVSGGGALFGLVLGSGITYDTDSERFVVNLSAGAGYFVSPSLSVGADVGVTIFDAGEETLKLFSVVPFLKFVTGLPEGANGFFVEPSLGFTVADFGEADAETLMQVGAWGGGHFVVGRGRNVAILVGPYVTYLKILSSDAADTDDVLVGVKFGVSTYLL